MTDICNDIAGVENTLARKIRVTYAIGISIVSIPDGP